MSFLIEGEQIVMSVHSSRITHFKHYLLAISMVAIPVVLSLLKISLPIQAVYLTSAYLVLISMAILIVAVLEIMTRRSSSYITNYRVLTSKGTLKKTYESCTYDKIANIRVIQSFPQRILRIGSIDISTVQKSEIMLNHIPNPSNVEKMIYNIMEKSRNPSQQQRPEPSQPAQVQHETSVPSLPDLENSGKKE